MAVTFEDTFTEASDVALSAHTPSPTGTSWSKDWDYAVTFQINVIAASDTVEATGTESNVGEANSAKPDPTVAEYDIEFITPKIGTNSFNRPCYCVFRWVDNDNYYIFMLYPTGFASDSCQLLKVVAQTPTSLVTIDEALATNDAFKIEVRNAAKKVYRNAAEILSTADNAITAAGKVGWGSGDTPGGWINGILAASFGMDNFKVTEQAGAAVVPQRIQQVGNIALQRSLR